MIWRNRGIHLRDRNRDLGEQWSHAPVIIIASFSGANILQSNYIATPIFQLARHSWVIIPRVLLRPTIIDLDEEYMDNLYFIPFKRIFERD